MIYYRTGTLQYAENNLHISRYYYTQPAANLLHQQILVANVNEKIYYVSS